MSSPLKRAKFETTKECASSNYNEDEEIENNKIIVKLKMGEIGKIWKDEVSIIIDLEVELRWLMINYCDKINVDLTYQRTKFMFNGTRIRETDTPSQLHMVNHDVIYVFPFSHSPGVTGRTLVSYATLSIRMHKQRSTLVRVTRSEPLLRQLHRQVSNDGVGNHVSTCFMCNGQKLTDIHTVEQLRMEDGDIIDAFNFDDNSTSLKIVAPSGQRRSLKVMSQDGTIRFFTVKGSTPWERVAQKCAELKGLGLDRLIFLFDGRRLSLDKTAGEQQLIDGSTIDLVFNFRGGFKAVQSDSSP